MKSSIRIKCDKWLRAVISAVPFLLVSGSAAKASVPSPPPNAWKGINYSPARHSYFRMLYDWYSYDSIAGMYVYQMADNDMATLS